MTQGTEGESRVGDGGESKGRPRQGPTQSCCCCCCLDKAFVNQAAEQTNREGGGGRREEGGRRERGREATNFIMMGLVTITFCPPDNLGPPSCSTASEKARRWERKGPCQEAADSSLIMRQGFPGLTSSPTLPPRCRHTPQNAGAMLP